MVRKGRRCCTKVGASTWERGSWTLSFAMLNRAFDAAPYITCAVLGVYVFEMSGMTIRAVMNASAVAILLADAALSVHRDPSALRGGKLPFVFEGDILRIRR